MWISLMIWNLWINLCVTIGYANGSHRRWWPDKNHAFGIRYLTMLYVVCSMCHIPKDVRWANVLEYSTLHRNALQTDVQRTVFGHERYASWPYICMRTCDKNYHTFECFSDVPKKNDTLWWKKMEKLANVNVWCAEFQFHIQFFFCRKKVP